MLPAMPAMRQDHWARSIIEEAHFRKPLVFSPNRSATNNQSGKCGAQSSRDENISKSLSCNALDHIAMVRMRLLQEPYSLASDAVTEHGGANCIRGAEEGTSQHFSSLHEQATARHAARPARSSISRRIMLCVIPPPRFDTGINHHLVVTGV